MKELVLNIGLEIHVQLKTESKMFCSCSADYFGAEPNTHVCPVCLGLPGALPVANQKAITQALQIGLALNCQVPNWAKFDRKNYFYPDLPKGFQISQFDAPFAVGGFVYVEGKKIRINRAHLEEDTGKLIHSHVGEETASLIDFNRSGVPLMEIVSEPDITSPEEAKNYAKKLNLIMRSLGVADADMEKAGMRFDANISLRPREQAELGTKVEIKNINSYRFLEKAIQYEVKRQAEAILKGEKIVQETRGWVESKGITQSQRTKEFAHDYRYFPEPDLTPFTNTDSQQEGLRSQLAQLPDATQARLVRDYALSQETARVLIEKEGLLAFYEEALQAYQQTEASGSKTDHVDSLKASKVANWVVGEVRRWLNQKNWEVAQIKMEPAALALLLYAIDQGKITASVAKQILGEALTGESVQILIEKESHSGVGEGDLETIIEEVLKTQHSAVDDYAQGKDQALSFLLGQVLRATGGKAEPAVVRSKLQEKLSHARDS